MKSARDRYKLALNCVAKYGLDSPNLQTEFARISSVFDSIDDLPQGNPMAPVGQPPAQTPMQAPPLVGGQPMASESPMSPPEDQSGLNGTQMA